MTIDARLQLAAARALESNLPVIEGVRRTKAAAVVMEPSTGAILACASLPSYDPNTIGSEVLDHLFGDEDKAAYDRARFEIYPPGSTFKVILAAAALEGKDGNEKETMDVICRHENKVAWEYGGSPHSRHVTDDEAEAAHGRIGLERALIESCNVYFASLGVALGPNAIFEFAHDRFRLELKGVSSPSDLEPNLPDNSYGQAKITASPMRMAAVAATAINGGYAVEPMLVLKPARMRSAPGRIIAAATASRLSTWMMEAVRIGTGRRAAVPGIAVGGKTGTAQNESGDRQSHSWFIGFAYPESTGPRAAVAFAFVIENGGYGGRAAAQAAHDFIVAWFQAGAARGNVR